MENLTATIKTQIKKIGRNVGLFISRTTTERELLEKIVFKFKPIDGGINLIRMGGDYDGGYLVPDELEGIEYCFSPGVSNIATFELDCLNRGIVSFLADYSVDKPPLKLPGCQFLKKYVGAYNNEKTITLENWVSQSLPRNYDKDIMMQMDIEGAEYETLLATPDSIMKKFRIIIVEFHNFHQLDNKPHYNLVNATIEKIRERFEPVHLHANNYEKVANVHGVLMPNVVEVTFLRKDIVRDNKNYRVLPHKLDLPNNPEWADVDLPSIWR